MRSATLSALALLWTAVHAPAQQAGLTPMQVMQLRTVTGVFPGPDGELVAFTRSEPRGPDQPPGPARNHLWLLERDQGGGPREVLLVGGEDNVGGVAWEPGGDRITFVDKRGDDEHPEVWAISPRDREIERVTATPHGVGAYRWRPDGGAIAFTALDPLPPGRARAQEMGFKQRVVDEDHRHLSLRIWTRQDGAVERLTEGVTVFSFEWAPTGKHLAAAIAPRNLVDDQYMFARLHRVRPDTGAVEPLVDNPGKLGHYAWSPDGRRLAYISATDRNDPHAGMLYLLEPGRRQPRLLTPGFRGMVHHVAWVGEDDPILVAAISEGVRSSLVHVDLETGELLRPKRRPEIAFDSFTPGGDTRVYAVASTPEHPEEVYLLTADDDAGMRATRLTSSNPWLAGVALGRQEVVRFRARDGLEIEGLLLHPVGYREGRRYPLVIYAHGGPEAHFSNGWNTSYSSWGQLLCARGYFAWYPNYRASTGYGVAFAKADHGDPMGAEFDDHLDAIAHLQRRGLIDPARVGLGGGSYGGYTAAWAATRHTEHFAAAVSFVPFVDIRTKWYTSDIPHEFYYVHYQEKWPHEQRGFLSDRSPLSWAERCRTPLLLLGGTSDPRVHPSQPFMLYRAVKFATDTPVRYVQYPGEGHGNRTNVYRYDYVLRTLRWFDHYLRPGDHRRDPPPPLDVDYGGWTAGDGQGR